MKVSQIVIKQLIAQRLPSSSNDNNNDDDDDDAGLYVMGVNPILKRSRNSSRKLFALFPRFAIHCSITAIHDDDT